MRRITELVTVVLTIALLVTLVFVLGFRPAADLKSDGYFKGPSVYATQAAFTQAAGRQATKPTGLVTLGQTNGDKPRFVDFIPFGAGSATNTFDYKVWAVTVCLNATGSIDDYDVQLFCSGTATLSATAGVGSFGITSAEKVCDTLTVAPATYGTAVTTAFGGVLPTVFTGSAGASLFVPETGNIHGFIFETDLTGASSALYLYRIGV